MKSFNPFTGKVIGEIPETTPQDLERIVNAGREAYIEWSNLPIEQRTTFLQVLPELTIHSINSISDTLVAETGMPITEAEGSTRKLTQRMEFLIKNSPAYLQEEKTILSDDKINIVSYEPIGLIGCIMPWNHPFTIPFWSIIPALIAGNVVLYKPSELTPLVGRQIDDLMSKLQLPNGVFSTVYGDGQLGRLISAHPNVRMISYAGSIRIARKVYSEASENIKKLVLENGGKDALIVGDYKDKEYLAEQILVGSLRHAGQLCSSVRRVYIPEKDYEEIANMIISKVPSYNVGDPSDADTVVGPLKMKKQLDNLNALVAEALKKGARIAYGSADQPSQLYIPTVLIDVPPDCLVLQEEHFGPLIPLVKTRNFNHAIELANQSEYGLNASIWHDDIYEAEAMAKKVKTGTVTINMLPSTHNYCSWHGVKLSGLGCVLSPDGIRQFTDRKNVRFGYKHG